MCGLVGLAGDTTGSWKDVFNELLLIDVVRGPHSTGAGFVGRNDEKLTLARRVGHPFNLLGAEEYEKAMSLGQPQKVMIGHNRFATLGEKTEENAHPFMFENVIGAHNGTLDTWCLKDLTNHTLYGTDSQAIFATINAKGIDGALKEMSGAWALTYYDKRDKTFNMIRNSKRPLHYAYSADRCTMIWASEPEMIEYVLGRRKKPLQKGEDGKNQIFNLPSDQLYTWKIPQMISGKIETPTMRKLEGRAWVTNYSPFHIGKGTKKTGAHTATKATSSRPIPFGQRLDTSKFRHPYRDGTGRIIKKTEFDFMVEEGCMFCNSNGQHFGQFVQVLGPYHGYHTPYMCEDCFNSPEQYEIAQYAL
jgi:predicted glutamine amidotransferase